MNARSALRSLFCTLGLFDEIGAWVSEGVYACAYPRDRAFARLTTQGISVLVNLNERAHDPARIARHGLHEVHVPVRDFTAPTLAQLTAGIAAMETTLAAGGRVAVHCGGGVGRTGTLLACYLVRLGIDADTAIARVRSVRVGAVETRAQRVAIHEYETSSDEPPLRVCDVSKTVGFG